MGPLRAAGAGAASGVLLFLAFPPVDIGPLAFLALVPLAYVFRESSGRSVTAASGAFGVTFFGSLLYWISLFGPEAYAALVLLLTAWTVVALRIGALARRGGRRILGVIVFAAAMIAGEWARGNWPFGGFSWGDLGYSQSANPLLLPLAAYTGVAGLSFVIALSSAAFAEALGTRKRPRRALAWAGVAVIAASAPYLLPKGRAAGEEVTVAMIQGNAPEDLEDPGADDLEVLGNHVRLTRNLPEVPDLIVWPESSLDTDPLANSTFGDAVASTARAVGAPIAAGAALDGPGGRFRNTTVMWNTSGEVEESYVKRHLVPFGEYVPGRSFIERTFGSFVEELEQVPTDAAPGDEVTIFEIPAGRFASVICFESTFPDDVRSFVGEGARLLVVSTNNSSFERTAASRQHVAFSRLRAAEHHMWVLHVALTGISAIVAPDGEVIEETGLFEEAVLTPKVRLATSATFYARTGDWLPLISVALVLLLSVGGLARRRRPATIPNDSGGQGTLIVIPTYNEADNIRQAVTSALEAVPGARVLVVDDASPDGTGAVVEELSSGDERIQLLGRPSKEGLGPAYLAGFEWGLDRDFGVIVEMDADLSHDAASLPELLAATEDADLVVGTRYMEGGEVVGWSRPRHLLSLAANLYARILLGLPLRDTTSGFRCYRRRALASMDLTTVHSTGYAFQIDMAYRVFQAGLPIAEIPIVFRERRSGMSKMSRRIVLEAVGAVAWWSLRDLLVPRHAPDTSIRRGSGEAA